MSERSGNLLSGACLILVMLAGGCSSGGAGPVVDPGDREMLAAAAAAQQAYARGAYDQAVEQYRRSLARARLQDEPALIGDQAYNLGIALMAFGHLDEAQNCLAEAEGALRRAHLPLADVLLVEARLAYRQQSGVDEAARRVLDDPASQPTVLHRAQVAVLRAEYACDQGNAAAAQEQLAQAQALSAALPAPGVAAGIARISGRLHLLRGETMAAGESFDLETKLQRANHRYPDLAKALLHAGEAYAKVPNAPFAADRYYRAALSLVAQEKPAPALEALASAASSAAQAHDEALQHLIDALQKEVRQTASTVSKP